MSSRGGSEGLEGLEHDVAVGVVGQVVLPASPNDLGPGACEDPFGVGVAFSIFAALLVAVGGPFVGVAGVTSKRAHDVSECAVGRVSEGD